MSRLPLIVLSLLGAALWCGEAPDVDVVVLKNKQIIVGKLVEDPAKPDYWLIKMVTGTMSLRKELVAGPELGVTSRFMALKDDDLAGLLEFARWARSKGFHAKALSALDKAFALIRLDPTKPFDLSALALYARLTDEQQGGEAALPLYRWYRQLGGTDAETINRLNACEAVVGRSDGDGGVPVPLVKLPPPPEPEKSGPSGTEGYEVKGWQSENPQYSNPIATEVVPLIGEDKLEGAKRGLKVTFEKGDKGKAAIKKIVNLDASNNHILSMQVKSGAGPLRIAIAVKTGNWVFHESAMLTVKASEGWKELRFDLKDPTFKSQKSDWINNTAVADLDEVKEIQLLVYNSEGDGTALISGLRFLSDQEM